MSETERSRKISEDNMKNRYKTLEKSFLNAERYYRNAKEFLRQAKIEYGIYKDEKPVREACGLGYLAALQAIDGFLLQMGLTKDKLPTSIDGYQSALKKYAARDGKVMAALTVVYQNLHILGYYRGGVDVEMIKSGFEKARFVIEHLSANKLG
ncbi:MAG: DUF5618 family protein [Candidatus Edwardsbacteria bacterium]